MTLKVKSTALEGVRLLEADVHSDARGFFLEVYRKDELHDLGVTDEFVQDNHSRSTRAVLRGIHFQDLSAPMAKLVRCSAGRIFDVAVDLRFGSPQFGRWVGVELSDENALQLYIPVGFGHGFATLSEIADVVYKCSGYYSPRAERTLAWNDPEIAIDWPVSDPVVSARDTKATSLREYRRNPAFHYQGSAA